MNSIYLPLAISAFCWYLFCKCFLFTYFKHFSLFCFTCLYLKQDIVQCFFFSYIRSEHLFSFNRWISPLHISCDDWFNKYPFCDMQYCASKHHDDSRLSPLTECCWWMCSGFVFFSFYVPGHGLLGKWAVPQNILEFCHCTVWGSFEQAHAACAFRILCTNRAALGAQYL